MTQRRHILSGILAVLVVLPSTAGAQQIGSCEPGDAKEFLEANNVRAAVYNSGSLFWRGSGNTYTVPKGGEANSIFTANLWVGGMVDGELRFAGIEYGPFEYFPGPLTEDGELPDPANCSAYDRIYNVTRRDLDRLDETDKATADILDWPWQHGAPVADGDGISDNYDLAAGDRPEITGHQMLWWVMNDLGGPHERKEAPPLGIEVRASAFSTLSSDPAFNNTTFYRFRLVNPQSYDIDSAFVGLYVDPDLGNAGDDFVGSDTVLGMAFTYNGDDFDDGTRGYGERPPALGVDFIQGPRTENDGVDNDGDGVVDEEGERRDMSAFIENHGDSGPQGSAQRAEQAYGYMQAVWGDGKRVTLGGTGYGGTTPINFMYPGDPVTKAFWSEEKLNDQGRSVPSDRRFIASAGPFQLSSGETEEIVIAVVWARGQNRLHSITELRRADQLIQESWDSGYPDNIPPPSIDDVPVLRSPADGTDGQPLRLDLRWDGVQHAMYYEVEVSEAPGFTDPTFRTLQTRETQVEIDGLAADTEYYWRVRPIAAPAEAPSSEIRTFRTGNAVWEDVGVQLIPGTENPAFLEMVGPGGVDPCAPESQSLDGCEEAGGNAVYGSLNSTGEYVMHHSFFSSRGPESSLPPFAPNDFEIRFTAGGSIAMSWDGDRIFRVPFEVWDVGSVELFNENDPSDDERLIPLIFMPDVCEFMYIDEEDPFGFGWKSTTPVYAHYADSTYTAWETFATPLLESAADGCYEDEEAAFYFDWTDLERGLPLHRIVFYGDPAGGIAPGGGTVIRFYTTAPVTEPPVQAAPLDATGGHDVPVSLSWNGPSWTYQVQVSADPAFDEIVLDSTLDTRSLALSALEEDVIYRWRVRLADPAGPWSEVWSFALGDGTNIAAESSAELPDVLTLRQNYPNPSNPATTIRFGLPEAGPVRMEVYDLLGRRIDTLVDRAVSAGWHEVVWDASGHASGVYVYVIEANKRRVSKSLVVVR